MREDMGGEAEPVGSEVVAAFLQSEILQDWRAFDTMVLQCFGCEEGCALVCCFCQVWVLVDDDPCPLKTCRR